MLKITRGVYVLCFVCFMSDNHMQSQDVEYVVVRTPRGGKRDGSNGVRQLMRQNFVLCGVTWDCTYVLSPRILILGSR